MVQPLRSRRLSGGTIGLLGLLLSVFTARSSSAEHSQPYRGGRIPTGMRVAPASTDATMLIAGIGIAALGYGSTIALFDDSRRGPGVRFVPWFGPALYWLSIDGDFAFARSVLALPGALLLTGAQVGGTVLSVVAITKKELVLVPEKNVAGLRLSFTGFGVAATGVFP